jgi:hypothetical protein
MRAVSLFVPGAGIFVCSFSFLQALAFHKGARFALFSLPFVEHADQEIHQQEGTQYVVYRVHDRLKIDDFSLILKCWGDCCLRKNSKPAR